MIRGLTRRYFVSLHKWLALSLGVWFVLVGITGSILAFDYEIDLTLNGELVGDCSLNPNQNIPFEQLLEIGGKVASNRLPQRIAIPYGKDVIRIYFDGPGAYEVAISRCSGKVLLVREFESSFVNTVFRLHAKLLSGDAGRIIVGFLGFGLLLSLVSGITLWWPGKKHFKKAWKVNWYSSRWRLLLDLHRVSGSSLGLLLLVTVVTGVAVSFPDTTRTLVSSAFPTVPRSHDHSAAIKKINVDEAVRVAQFEFPNAVLMAVKLPTVKRPTTQVVLRQAGDPMKYTGQTSLRIRSANDIEVLIDTQKLPPGELILRWIFPLHSGEAFGFWGRVLTCILGFLPLGLFCTGIWLWLKKRSISTRTAHKLGL